MQEYTPKVVDVYPYCKVENEVYFLLMKRNPIKIYGGQWRMVGGKVEKDETYWQAALRELKEETGFTPNLFWTVPSINQFYDPKSDSILHIPAFACEISSFQKPVLNEEHIDFEWVKSAQINDYISWPEQKRLILLINELVLFREIKQWEIDF